MPTWTVITCCLLVFSGIHYVGEMYEGNENKVLIDHITDGQLQWAELDKDLDLVRVIYFTSTCGLVNCTCIIIHQLFHMYMSF